MPEGVKEVKNLSNFGLLCSIKFQTVVVHIDVTQVIINGVFYIEVKETMYTYEDN